MQFVQYLLPCFTVAITPKTFYTPFYNRYNLYNLEPTAVPFFVPFAKDLFFKLVSEVKRVAQTKTWFRSVLHKVSGGFPPTTNLSFHLGFYSFPTLQTLPCILSSQPDIPWGPSALKLFAPYPHNNKKTYINIFLLVSEDTRPRVQTHKKNSLL